MLGTPNNDFDVQDPWLNELIEVWNKAIANYCYFLNHWSIAVDTELIFYFEYFKN